MLIIIGIAAAAAVAVIAYEHYSQSRPNSSEVSARRAHQLAAVVLVMSRAVEGVIEALALGMRPVRVGPQRVIHDWEDYE